MAKTALSDSCATHWVAKDGRHRTWTTSCRALSDPQVHKFTERTERSIVFSAVFAILRSMLSRLKLEEGEALCGRYKEQVR